MADGIMRKKKGFTIIEILIGVGILSASFVVIVESAKAYLNIIERAQNIVIATFEAQAALEERIQISGTTAYPVLAESFDRKKNGKNVSRTNSSFLWQTLIWDERVSVSWKEGNALIGEDSNLNGVLDTTPPPSEDVNNNLKLDSPVTIDVPIPRNRW